MLLRLAGCLALGIRTDGTVGGGSCAIGGVSRLDTSRAAPVTQAVATKLFAEKIHLSVIGSHTNNSKIENQKKNEEKKEENYKTESKTIDTSISNEAVLFLKEDDFLWGYKQTNDAMEARINVRAKQVQEDHVSRFPPIEQNETIAKTEEKKEEEKIINEKDMVIVDADDQEAWPSLNASTKEEKENTESKKSEESTASLSSSSDLGLHVVVVAAGTKVNIRVSKIKKRHCVTILVCNYR